MKRVNILLVCVSFFFTALRLALHLGNVKMYVNYTFLSWPAANKGCFDEPT